MKGTLTRKLFFRITPTILVTIVAIGSLAFYSATREINNVYDAQLIDNANVLWMLLQDEFKEAKGQSAPKQVEDIDFNMGDQLKFNADADDYADARMFRAWEDKKLAMWSSTAFPASTPMSSPGFSEVSYKGEQWRIYNLPIPDTSITIEVGEKVVLRYTLVSNILLNIFLPLLVLIPLIGGLLWFGIKNGLGVILMLVEQISRRSPDDLAPIELEGLSKDIVPLGRSINQLFDKLQHSIDSERRFADHAAHQLRTPLASLKLQMQMLARAGSEQERAAILNELMSSNERATQLVSKLLTAARVSHQPIHVEPIFLYRAVAGVIAEMGLLITEKKLEVSLEGDETAQINVDETLLHLLIGNLIENAIKFTPVSGSIRVAINTQGDKWLLCVTDTGPGIPNDQRELVLQRFYRINMHHTEGTGLGLAIVADIIERFSGSVAFKTPENGIGLIVEVLFPKA